MEQLSQFLSPLDVRLEDLLLDPNNPRFAELGEEPSAVPESRYAETKVQQTAYEKMKNSRFDVIELRDTIRELGFLPMDRLVIRKWRDSNPEAPKYVVVEGNRRVTALKWLLELYEQGKLQLTDGQRNSYSNFQVLRLDEERAPKSATLILPGLRHVSGIKEWGPYQKARMVYELRATGNTPQEVAQSLGLSTREANSLWRAYLALEQMKADEEYGEHAEASFYSYFQEVFKRANVKDWLGWSDAEGKFAKAPELRMFYGWIHGTEGDPGEEGVAPKLPESKSVRELGRIIEDPQAFTVFKTAEGTLTRALARVEVDREQEFIPAVAACESTLKALSPDRLRKMTDDEIVRLKQLSERISQLVKDRNALMTTPHVQA